MSNISKADLNEILTRVMMENTKSKIEALVKTAAAELDADDKLDNHERARLLIEKMEQFKEAVKEAGETLQPGDLDPFKAQLKTYIAEAKREKEAKNKAAKKKAKRERQKTRKKQKEIRQEAHRLAREGLQILKKRDADAAAASAKGDDEEEIIFGAAARGPPPGFREEDKGRYSPNGGRKTRKKKRKRKKRRKTKKRRKRKTRRTRKKRGRGKVTKQTKKKQTPGILKSKMRNPFAKPRKVTFKRPGRSKLRIQHNAIAMMDSAIDETQGAQKTDTFDMTKVDQALPFIPPPTMPTFQGDSGSDEELANIAAAAAKNE